MIRGVRYLVLTKSRHFFLRLLDRHAIFGTMPRGVVE